MRTHTTAIPEVIVLEPSVHSDQRGFLSEVFNLASLSDAGIEEQFVQENHTYTKQAGTVRGLHVQIPPHPAAKLVRCTRGSIFDVAVDLRRGSKTYGRHVSQVLSAENWLQMFVPGAFAHGFCTLEDDTEIVYKTTALWNPELDRGVAWDDPELRIEWPVSANEAILSDKDRTQPAFSDLEAYFE